MDDRAVSELRALGRLDSDLAAESERLDSLDRQVAAIRSRAEAIAGFVAGFQEEERRVAAAVAEARSELARRERAVADGVRAVDEAAEDDAAAAERALARAAERAGAERANLARLEGEYAELSSRAAQAPGELTALREAASALNLSGPSGDLIDWASAAHADLFVSTRQVAAQRDRLAREANELASMLLDEPTYGSTVRQVIARIDGNPAPSAG